MQIEAHAIDLDVREVFGAGTVEVLHEARGKA